MSSEEGQVEAILLMAGFTEVDINNDGYLTVEELRNALKNTELLMNTMWSFGMDYSLSTTTMCCASLETRLQIKQRKRDK